MNDLINICLPCGCCCDGSLIGFVEVDKDELPEVQKIMDVEVENCKGFFLQPCKKFSKLCTIYAQRPKQCIKFECGLLKSVEQKSLKFDDALEIVSELKQKKLIVEKMMLILKLELKSGSFYFKMVELNKLLNNKASKTPLTNMHLELRRVLDQLESLVVKNFGISLY